ncbi:hypothetical protein EV424DRAFT_1429384 [Suillus variegatus]|nr:hypothetical protein EV424DRAFT_1429384 [Suillus variegatus]
MIYVSSFEDLVLVLSISARALAYHTFQVLFMPLNHCSQVSCNSPSWLLARPPRSHSEVTDSDPRVDRMCTSRCLMFSSWFVSLRFKSPALVRHSKDLGSIQQGLWRGVVWIDRLPERR